MKQNQRLLAAPEAEPAITVVEPMANGLAYAVRQFLDPSGWSTERQCMNVGFANGVCLAIGKPEPAASLLEILCSTGLPEVHFDDGVASYFKEDRPAECWTWSGGATVESMYDEWAKRFPPVDAATRHSLRTLFAAAAGIQFVSAFPAIAKQMDAGWSYLPSENRFLSARLYDWETNAWVPRAEPFLEFTGGFHHHGPKHGAAILAAAARVLTVALQLTDPWAPLLWSESGFGFARSLPAAERQAIMDEVPREEFSRLACLYHYAVSGTATSEREIRLDRATMYFLGEAGPEYARAYCAGKHPRWVAHGALDFGFWMGIICGPEFRVPPLCLIGSQGN